MKGIRQLRNALLGFQQAVQQIDTAVKTIREHKKKNDVKLARKHGLVHRLMALAEDTYRKTMDELNVRRDHAARQHAQVNAELDGHEQRAVRIQGRLQELLK